MADLETTYMGLNLKNPVLASSSGKTGVLESIIEIEKQGAGGIVLKSIFEEQITAHVAEALRENINEFSYPQAEDYIISYTRQQYVDEYLTLIKQARRAVSLPVIASVNCVSKNEWPVFAKKIEDAGADALELNIAILPSDPERNPRQNEQVCFEIVQEIQKQVTIPVALKISPYFSGLMQTATQLSNSGIKGLVLFNRFFQPDIDTEHFKVISTSVLSRPEEISTSLRWVALLSDRVGCDISATTGIHSGNDVVKQILAGAQVVQVASTLYAHGLGQIGKMVREVEGWMDKHSFSTLAEFRGRMSHDQAENPAGYERVQFMRYFGGFEE